MSSEDEVKEFLLEHYNRLEKCHVEQLNAGWDFDELIPYLEVDVNCLDCYNGDDWFVGFRVGKTQQANELSDNVADAVNLWEQGFPGVEGRVVWAVVHS
jgi:hypothetical protein